MPRFPRRKADIDALANAIVAGIAANPLDYPAPTFDTTNLVASMASTQTVVGDRQQMEAELALMVEVENAAYEEQEDEMHLKIDLAEATFKGNAAKLQLIGWDAAAAATAAVPGQPRALDAVIQGPGTVFLDWKSPETGSGGRVRFYRIERQIKDVATQEVTEDWGVWERSAPISEIMLTGQPRQVEINYRVFAKNNEGESIPSNSVMVVL